jgi:tetratricopeptide (TPR) repeat protein
LRSPWPWLTLAAVIGALFLRRRQPTLGFLTLWWVATLLPSLDIRQLSFPGLGERFSYLPSVGLCLALAFALFAWVPRRLLRPKTAAVAVAGFGALLVLWGAQDVRLIPHWHDNEALWSYSARVAPNFPLVHLYLADVELRKPDLAAAAREYETAQQMNRASFRPLLGIDLDSYLGLGRVARMQGRLQTCIHYYQQAIQIAPRHPAGYKALGSVYFPWGNYAKAAEYYAQAVRINPQDLESRFILGTCLLKVGDFRAAADQFHTARQLDPTYWQAFEAEAKALEAAGEASAAAAVRSREPAH